MYQGASTMLCRVAYTTRNSLVFPFLESALGIRTGVRHQCRATNRKMGFLPSILEMLSINRSLLPATQKTQGLRSTILSSTLFSANLHDYSSSFKISLFPRYPCKAPALPQEKQCLLAYESRVLHRPSA